MPLNRRSFIEGGTYFFTVVTYNRLPMLTTDDARPLLDSAWIDVHTRFPFTTLAICLLPDHLHCIWSLPESDADYSVRWKEIKRLFTKSYSSQIGPGETRNASRLKRGEAAVWQRRFWEHTIRDQDDLNRHTEYIHYNPVKHWAGEKSRGLAVVELSSLCQRRVYAIDWGEVVSKDVEGMRIWRVN